jgi:hypothetical protein
LLLNVEKTRASVTNYRDVRQLTSSEIGFGRGWTNMSCASSD